jgi:ribonuclease J
MAGIVTGGAEIRYDKVSVIPLGGQSEIGQVLWVISYGGELLLVDAGAAYPGEDLPGVDLLLPNTNFLEANRDRILALLLTNGHEEHSGAVTYLLNHLNIPRIMGPRFVMAQVSQVLMHKKYATAIDTIETRHPYQIGTFEVEWIQVNDAIADACALRIGTTEGNILYTSSFKLDQTPVDNRLLDVARLAQIGDNGTLLLISDSAGSETRGYTPSERAVAPRLEEYIESAPGRVIVVVPGTNTHRLQILFDLALKLNRKVVLYGETLMQTAVVAVVTGNLIYDRKIEASLVDLAKLPDDKVLIVATGVEGDPMDLLDELAYGKNKELCVKEGDTVIYSAEIYPGRSRQMAMLLDEFLSAGVKTIYSAKHGVNVSKHASREELKFMLSIVKPKFFVPALGEGRHIMHHAQLAEECGVPDGNIFPLQNGEILEIGNGIATAVGSIEASAVMYNRDQGERVTTFSVNERRNLSLEGVVTVGCVVDEETKLLGAPVIEAGASGFLQSPDWPSIKEELCAAIVELAAAPANGDKKDANALRASIRELVAKSLRARLQSKPTIQVVVQEVATTHPE